MRKDHNEEDFWNNRYQEGSTGWDIGYPSTPIKAYVDQIEDKNIRILIPGAGNAYEAEYLWQNGFTNTFILDLSKLPLLSFQKRNPDFPSNQIIHGNFFEHQGEYNLIIEQTFFCSFDPEEIDRSRYAEKMYELLLPGGKLVGVWFKHPYIKGVSSRPFGGNKEEYLTYFKPYFRINTFENCHNSITPRSGNELFGIFEKK
ncbi:TPMT family class I SAM-dependent methyltransferase [Portibacter marinus]|uniref:TPMT family class I SAM-dependent methyltransferase n=1 Tax=Portibacter marinus TaxID=2898660 RepID=UPI001F3F2259|nr:TPMT family class I SAM-dependent methyltransferase [Portibacter marinus]